MKLTKDEANLFFDLMWKLQWYTNNKYKIISPIKYLKIYEKLSLEEKSKVRDYLFENITEIVDCFAQDNPFDLDQNEIMIIRGWKQFIRGNFFIERVLKKYAIFINQDTEDVYGVLGLYDSIDEIIPKNILPLYVKAILLPFKDKIVYDGLLQSYSLSFGRGITSDLKYIYLRAKQNEQIIFNIEQLSQPKKGKKLIPAKDWTPEINELVTKAKKLKGGKGQPLINSPIFSLVKLSLDLAQKSTSGCQDVEYYYQKLQRAEDLIRKIAREVDYFE